MENKVLYYSIQNKIKGNFGYKPCNMEITSDYFAFSQGSVLGVAVGGLVGYAISSGAHKKNGVTLIPLNEITNVEMKKGFGTAMIYIQAVNRPQLTFACYSKKDMETIYNLLSK